MVLCLTLYQRPLKLSLFLFYLFFFSFFFSSLVVSTTQSSYLLICSSASLNLWFIPFSVFFFSTVFFISIWFFFILDYPESLLGFSHSIFLKNPNILANPVLSYTVKTSNFSFFINSSLKFVDYCNYLELFIY